VGWEACEDGGPGLSSGASVDASGDSDIVAVVVVLWRGISISNHKWSHDGMVFTNNV
jgi:hypothetical protein